MIIKKRKIYCCFTPKQHFSDIRLLFLPTINLIKFAMEKDFVKRISVWEKISDFMMDISKYVLTAVIITSAFEELSGVGWAMYVVGVAGAAIFFAASLLIMYKSNKKR